MERLTNALEHIDSLLAPEELAESELRVSVIGELIKAREERGLTQKELGELSGIRQPAIARMENGKTIPTVSTLMKLLVPMGKKLAIVPLDYQS